MSRLHKNWPVILSSAALLFTMLSYLALAIPDSDYLFWPLMLYGVYVIPITATILFVALIFIVGLLIIKPSNRTPSVIIPVVILMLVSGALAPCSLIGNAINDQAIQSSARLGSHTYYLTFHHLGTDALRIRLYECDRFSILCQSIPFSNRLAGTPWTLRADASANVLEVISAGNTVIFDYSPSQ